METKYSPDPWRQCGFERGGCICGQIWSETQDFHIATCHVSHDDLGEISVDQMKANAKLIAAAPDLLTALQALLMVSNRIEPKKWDESLIWIHNDRVVREMAEAAIKKATE